MHSKKLKCIGGEYCWQIGTDCKMYGIKHQKTPPKTPQLNGLAGNPELYGLWGLSCNQELYGL
jgi:hypothetical protein